MSYPHETGDRYSLKRFVDAQDGYYADVCAELSQGRKQSHWMWFIFPQIKGLGNSITARQYAIGGREEAEAYLRHPVLGVRLRECTDLVNAIENRTIEQIFSWPDNLKFRSCMTLFSQIANDNDEFVLALRKYFAGEPDLSTIAHLSDGAAAISCKGAAPR